MEKKINNVNVVSKEMIKPSSPTTLNLQNFKISLLDQFSPLSYIPFVLFYPPHHNHNTATNIATLKKALSEALSLFYPLAGRFVEGHNSVNCNDQGAEFLEAQVDGLSMASFIEQPHMEDMKKLLPRTCEIPTESSANVVQLAIQVNHFKCGGGFAIGLCMSHKIADAATLGMFIKCWSAIARNEGATLFPKFEAADILPPKPNTCTPNKIAMNYNSKGDSSVMKRFLFDASAIAALKAKVTLVNDKKIPTRVEVVSALLWQCLISLAREKRRKLHYILVFPVNLRGRMTPPLVDFSFGNIYKAAMAESPILGEMDPDPELYQLVSQFRDANKKIDGDYAKKQELFNGILVLHEPFTEIFMKQTEKEFCGVSSWCRFGFYETDFGWGRPVWVSSYKLTSQKGIILLDAFDGEGVEALVTLDGEDMVKFEKNPDLLAFSSI